MPHSGTSPGVCRVLMVGVAGSAVVLHELTHLCVAYLFGATSVYIDSVGIQFTIRIEFPESVSALQRRMVALAPTLLGSCLAVIVFMTGEIFWIRQHFASLPTVWVVGGLAWLLFTVPSLSDLRTVE